MKILLVKRLESSFFAFKNTLDRFIKSYKSFIKEFNNGYIYFSKKYTNKIYELLEVDDEELIQKLLDEDKAQRYESKEFRDQLIDDLERDLEILEEVKSLWVEIDYDPKLDKLIKLLSTDSILKKNKVIVFTESKETADYLESNLKAQIGNFVISYSGQSAANIRDIIISNFDAKAKHKKDDYRILVTTEVLSEGVNLHRSNVVVNYDIPWNPIRLIQRVGRINRLDTEFEEIYAYNFFPTKQSNDQIKLKEAAESKIHAFIEMLGNDARLLTDGEEVKSFDLFSKLNSKKTITGEDEEEDSELRLLQIIKQIREKNPNLFEVIKRLPKKARTARKHSKDKNALITYFRKGKLQKFFITEAGKNNETKEIDIMGAAVVLEADKDVKREGLQKDFYDLLEENKKAFQDATTEELQGLHRNHGRDNASFLLKVLKSNEIKHFKGFTEEEEEYVKDVIKLLEEGGVPKQTSKTLVKDLKPEINNGLNPRKIVGVFKINIAPEFFKEMIAENAAQTSGPREVILSEYLIAK